MPTLYARTARRPAPSVLLASPQLVVRGREQRCSQGSTAAIRPASQKGRGRARSTGTENGKQTENGAGSDRMAATQTSSGGCRGECQFGWHAQQGKRGALQWPSGQCGQRTHLASDQYIAACCASSSSVGCGAPSPCSPSAISSTTAISLLAPTTTRRSQPLRDGVERGRPLHDQASPF
eukprot:COSAG02_NODE_6134_length_3778_cov_4.101386_3_plen_179_part_00